ncbi:MAG: putative rane protein [Verrucomicrobiales bacterium]|nr:putative rane protein [Verrucomicrobiales bacterium]
MHTRSPATTGRTLSQQWQERFVLVLLNVAITAVLQLGCVLTAGAGLRGVSHFIIPAAILSQAAFLNLYPLSFAALFTMGCGVRTARMIGGLCFGLAQCIILTDVAAFRLFGLHFLKATTFQLLTTPGVRDVFHPGTATIFTLLACYLLILGGVLWVSVKLVPRLVTRASCRRMIKLALLVVLGCALTERTMLGWRGLKDAKPLDALEDTLTFYIPLDLTPLARKFGWSPVATPLALWDRPGTLDLPKNPLGPVQPSRQPNVLIITIESARADALTTAMMPNTSQVAEEGWRLNQHFSTGSCTPLGCFGIFYALSVNYMGAVAEQKRTSPAVDYLRSQNYEFCLLSAAGLAYSGLPETAFRELGGSIQDKWKGEHVDRDRLMTDKFLNFLDGRKARSEARPFFGFLFFDASHLPYDYPPEDAVLEFKLKPGEVNYALLSAQPAASGRFKNCYLNSLHYVDRQIGYVLQRLRDSGQYDNTVVIIAGDHGEEFGECGHFSHLNGLNRFQLQTLAAVRLPGEPSRVVTNLTSHVDFFPTLLTWMGVTNAPTDYSTGVPIQSNSPNRFVVVNGTLENADAVAIVNKGSFTTFRPHGVLYQDLEEQELGPEAPRATQEQIGDLLRQYRCFFK